MWIENLCYSITFIISAGMAAIGIMISYQLYQSIKKPILSILLYQQIFLFSFFIYGIWGNMALREIISDLNLSIELTAKLAFFVPLIGIPFLVVSWFMLLKISLNLNGFKFSKTFIYAYFPVFIVLLIVLTLLIQNKVLCIPVKTDLFIVRIIVVLNLLVHVIFLVPFFKPKPSASLLKETGFNFRWALIYFAAVFIYSVAMSFFSLFGFISTCFGIILVFSASTLIPVKIRFYTAGTLDSDRGENMDFNAFCKFYEISNREAEVILEICSGKSNKAISEKLFITLQTVKDHNHHIYTKTGVKSRVQLANLVREKTGKA